MKVFNFKKLVTVILFSLLITFSYYATKTIFANYQIGEPSEVNIYSPTTVTYVDEEETEKQKETVLSQVQEVYEFDPNIQAKQEETLKGFFESVIEAKLGQTNAEEGGEVINVELANPYKFSEVELQAFLDTDLTTLKRMKEVFGKELEKFYSARITTEKIEEAREEFKDNTNFYFFDENVRAVLLDKMTAQLQANLSIDNKETEKRKKEAVEGVKAVTETVQRGQTIVAKGENITKDDYELMKEVGIISDNFDIEEAMERFPYVLMLLVLLHLMLWKFSKRDIENTRLYFFVFIMTTLTVFLSNFFQNTYFTYTLAVIALVAITTFLSSTISLVYAVILGLLLNTGDFVFIVMAFSLGAVQALGHNPRGNRYTFLNLGVVMSMILVLSFSVINNILGRPISVSDYYPFIVAPLLGTAIIVGLFPYLESMLRVVTPLKLHELSRTDHKLINRLVNEAPGTFHHSLRVGSLAEAAAEAIGANGLLLKVGAIFHDVGKLENPTYFIENLVDTNIPNPHNEITPEQSAQVILAHPIDSVKLCRKHRLPEVIIQLIESHHGDSLVEHFYNTAKNKDENVEINKFKYRTPLPKTKEEGILLLADTTEAYSRVIINKPKEEFEHKLKELIFKKIEEGQLRECELTMKEIQTIIDTFIEHLLGANHKRSEYAKAKKQG